MEILQRELIYLWYYFSVQMEQIFGYWVLGMVLGSAISVFGKGKIHGAFSVLGQKKMGVLGLISASLLGIASPLCMYGTIPLAASFSQKGVRDDLLAAFMMSSILLNPQLLIYSAALGTTAFVVRLLSCIVCGIGAGLLVRYLYRNRNYFNFSGFDQAANRDVDPNLFLRFLKNLGRNVKATAPWFLLGVLLSALFQRYVPAEAFGSLFGEQEGFGLLLAATIGVPLYACGGGTIPLLQQWLASGMSLGAAASFMITGPATKITNLGALKIVLGVKRFALYLIYVMLASLVTGHMVNPKCAMTGEVSLKGRLMPIGGLPEKLMAAVRSGVKKVFIPKENVRDLSEVPQEIRDRLKIVPVQKVAEVLEKTGVLEKKKKGDKEEA